MVLGVVRVIMAPSPGAQESTVREYDWAIDSPCVGVIDAIARYEGIETPRMAELLPTLHDSLDTDALDTLISTSPSLVVSFWYADYHVQLTDETVTISQPTRPSIDSRVE